MPDENNLILAAKIANLLDAHAPVVDLSSIALSIDEIKRRLYKIEAKISQPDKLQTQEKPHHSIDRFTVIEGIADEIAVSLNNEKACSFEPNDRPCDHCSMCSSRGF